MQVKILVDTRSQCLYDNIVAQLHSMPDASIILELCDLEFGDLNLHLIDNKGNLKGKVIFDRKTLSDTVASIVNNNLNIEANYCPIIKTIIYGISTDTSIQAICINAFNAKITAYTNECLTDKCPTQYRFINDSTDINANSKKLSTWLYSAIDTAFMSSVHQLMLADIRATADFIIRYCKSIYSPSYNIFAKKKMRAEKNEARFAHDYNYKYVNDSVVREKISAILN